MSAAIGEQVTPEGRSDRSRRAAPVAESCESLPITASDAGLAGENGQQEVILGAEQGARARREAGGGGGPGSGARSG